MIPIDSYFCLIALFQASQSNPALTVRNMQTILTNEPILIDDIRLALEDQLRSNIPNRNEKYYHILLSAWDQLSSESCRTEITADAIIKSCAIARPTWYAYFKSVQEYYEDVIEVLGHVIVEYAIDHLQQNITYDNWTLFDRKMRLLVFLSNTKTLAAYFPGLHLQWLDIYQMTVEGYAGVMCPILKLSPARAQLLVKNIVNEMIIHKEKYFNDIHSLDKFIKREYVLFLTEQNS